MTSSLFLETCSVRVSFVSTMWDPMRARSGGISMGIVSLCSSTGHPNVWFCIWTKYLFEFLSDRDIKYGLSLRTYIYIYIYNHLYTLFTIFIYYMYSLYIYICLLYIYLLYIFTIYYIYYLHIYYIYTIYICIYYIYIYYIYFYYLYLLYIYIYYMYIYIYYLYLYADMFPHRCSHLDMLVRACVHDKTRTCTQRRPAPRPCSKPSEA